MFMIRRLPPQIDPSLLKLLIHSEPATIGHFRHTGFMDPAIRAQQIDVRIAGTAVTVQSAGPDSAIVHYALSHIRPGDVMVIDRCGDHKHAITGGAVIYAAKKAGVAGVIIDGVATDFQELRDFGVPVWCRGTTPVTGKMLGLGGGFCIPVSCGGVAVNSGDAIVADENGVLVMSPLEIEANASRAITMQKEEKEVTFKRIDAGEKIGDISGANALVLSRLAP